MRLQDLDTRPISMATMSTAIQKSVELRLKVIAEAAIEDGKEYYLSRRKEKYFDFITRSMVYSTSFSPGVNVKLEIGMGAPVAPYAIFVDQGFTAPGGGAKIFEGYHFSEHVYKKVNARLESEITDAIISSFIDHAPILTPWRRYYTKSRSGFKFNSIM